MMNKTYNNLYLSYISACSIISDIFIHFGVSNRLVDFQKHSAYLFKKEISIIWFPVDVKKILVKKVVLHLIFLYIYPPFFFDFEIMFFLLSRHVIIYKRLFLFILTLFVFEFLMIQVYFAIQGSTATSSQHRYW